MPAVLLVAACSGGAQRAAPTTTTSTESSSSSSSSTLATTPPRKADDAGWVGRGPQPISQLVAAGGHLVYLGVDDQQQLHLVGLDPSTGKVAWERDSTIATHVPGVEEHLVSDGTTVFDVEPSIGASSRVAFPAQAGGAADVVAVDASTGKDGWHREFSGINTPLEKCGDGVCVFVTTADDHFDVTRLDPATGDVLSDGTVMFDPPIADDGEFAISAARDTNEVVLTSGFGQKVVWSHQRAELFGTNDVTPDSGWSGFHTGGVWVVWLGGKGTALGATSGITDDGKVLWTHADTSPCFPLTGDPITAPILCGRVDAAAQRFLLGTIQGIDPPTGTAQWSLDTGDLDIANLGSSVVRFDATHFGFHLASGDVGLDVASGPAGPPATTSGWCELVGQFVQVEGQRSILALSWSPCTLGVGPDHQPPTTVPDFAGPTVDGFGAWVEDGEVRAAKVS